MLARVADEDREMDRYREFVATGGREPLATRRTGRVRCEEVPAAPAKMPHDLSRLL